MNYRSSLVRRPHLPTDPRRRSTVVTGVIVTAASLAVLLWWSWPSLAGHDEQLDVLVVAEGELLEARRSMDLRVRQTGRSLEWIDLEPSWCDRLDELVGEIEERSPGRVVVSAAGPCLAVLLDGLPDDDPILVPVPGTTSTPELLAGLGATVVDPARLIGSRAPGLVFPCEWWDPCTEGVAVVRDETGALTPDGGERLARLVVAEL